MYVVSGSLISCAQTFVPKSHKIIKIPTESTLDDLSDVEPQQSSGSFSLMDAGDGKNTVFGNRFIIWRTCGSTLLLEEHSFERDLEQNVVTVQFGESRLLPGCRLLYHPRTCLLQFVVCSVSSVHIFAFEYVDNPGLSFLAGFPECDKLGGSHRSTCFNCSSTPIRASVSSYSDGRIRTALCLKDGTILLVVMPSFGDYLSESSQHVLHHDGIMRRFTFARFEPEMEGVTDSILSTNGNDTLIHAIYRNGYFRIWSTNSLSIICSANIASLSKFYPGKSDFNPKSPLYILSSSILYLTNVLILDCSVAIRKCQFGNTLFLLIHLGMSSNSSFLLLRPIIKKKTVGLVMEIEAPLLELIDFALITSPNASLWALWRDPDTSCTVLKHCQISLDDLVQKPWVDINYDLVSVFGYSRSIECAVFDPDRYSFDTVHRALQACCNSLPGDIQPGDWSTLRTRVQVFLNGAEFAHKFPALRQTEERINRFWGTVRLYCDDFHRKQCRPLGLLFCSETVLVVESGRFSVYVPPDEHLRSLATSSDWSNESTVLDDCFRLIDGSHDDATIITALNVKLVLCYQYLPLFVEKFVTCAAPKPIELAGNGPPSPSMCSSLSNGLLAASLSYSLQFRLTLCSRLLRLLSYLPRTNFNSMSEDQSQLSHKLIPELSVLETHYTTLNVILTTKMNLEKRVPMWMPTVLCALYHHSRAGEILKRTTELSLIVDNHPASFGLFAPLSVFFCLSALWPSSPSILLVKFLSESGQFETLLEYCRMIRPWPSLLEYALRYYEGVALTGLDNAKESLPIFLQVLQGIRNRDRVLLDAVFSSAETMNTTTTDFFLKILATCEQAIKQTNDDDPNIPLLYTIQFKHELDGDRFSNAVIALRDNPSSESRKICLRALLARLTEHKEVFVSLRYGSILESDLVDLLESRARAADLDRQDQPDYYELLYAFHSFRSNFRRAAACMYELATRLSRENGPSTTLLHRRTTALTVCEQALLLCTPGNRWIAIPDSDKEFSVRPLAFVPRLDIVRERILAESQLAISQDRDKCSSPVDILNALLSTDLYDRALSLIRAFEMDACSLLETLTGRCLELDVSGRGATWLDECRMLTGGMSSRGATPSEAAWKVLQSYVDRLVDLEPGNGTILRTVAIRILSSQRSLPLWLSERYSKIDFPDYLRVLIDFDHLLEAQTLLLDHLNGILDQFTSSSVKIWLPYSTIDQLMYFSDRSDSPDLRTNELESTIRCYFERLESFDLAGTLYQIPDVVVQ